MGFVRGLADDLEPVIEVVIWLCGWSAILFVLAIFAFVFREALPVIWDRNFDFREFFFSIE